MAIPWLANVLRAAGVAVVEEDNWQARGASGSFAPIGVLWHHTAATSSLSNPAPSLSVVMNGRPDLAGPLCHALVDYNGVFHLISANRANHAGASRGSGPIPAGDGNTMLIGWEIDYNGVSQSITPAQYSASVVATAAVLRALRRNASHARGHRETSTTGKIDPSFVNLDVMRADVARHLSRGGVSDFSGDGFADVLGVDAAGVLWYYPHEGSGFGPRVQLGPGWQNFRHVKAADWSGDGHADVLAVDSDGRLLYYANNGLRLSPAQQISFGFQGFRHVMPADWSGDGHADVLGVDAGGDLWYYPHEGDGLGPRVRIGTGWQSFLHVMAADWSGDGHADVLGVDAGGAIWYYPHEGNGFGPRVQIGSGWFSFRFVRAMDWSGDLHADVVGVDSAGRLLYYPHNGNGLSPAQQIGTDWGTFRHIL